MSEANARSEFTRSSILSAIAAGFGMFVGPTPMASVAAAMFMVPLQKEFQLSTTQVSMLLLIQPITVALCSATAGRLLDRYGVRRVLLPIVALFALGFVYMANIHSVAQLIAGFVWAGICVSFHCYSSYTKVLSQWFDRNRGVVLGVAITFGSGLGAMTLPQVAGPWMQSHGWRSTYLLMAAMVFVLGFLVMAALLREPRPGEVVRVTGSGAADAVLEGMTRAEALRTGAFWLLALAIFLAPMTIVGTVQHSFKMLTERGFTPAQAGNALSSIYIGGMTGYFTSGPLLERVRAPRVAMLYFAASIVGVWWLHTTMDAQRLVPAAILMGLGQGSEMCIAAYLVGRYFGLKSYGAIYGTLYSIANAGIATGIVSMGIVHDRAASYGPMRYVFVASLVAVMLLFLAMPRYRYARAGGTT